jgi:hypothetical protein
MELLRLRDLSSEMLLPIYTADRLEFIRTITDGTDESNNESTFGSAEEGGVGGRWGNRAEDGDPLGKRGAVASRRVRSPMEAFSRLWLRARLASS